LGQQRSKSGSGGTGGSSEPAGSIEAIDPVTAWVQFCRRLIVSGERLLSRELPASADRAEGVRHLARLATHALQWHLEHGDPDRPRFYRFNDHLTRWGGPNVDNTYLRAKVAAGRCYRIRGRLGGCGELIVSTHEGDMQMGKPRVFAEISRDDMDVDAYGCIEIHIGGEARARNWLPLDRGVDHVLVREYFSGDSEETAGEFHIDCTVSVEAAHASAQQAKCQATSGDSIGDALAAAADWVDESLVFWWDYIERIAAFVPANTLSPPRCPPGGAADILYGGGPYALEPGQALLVEFERPQARYWSAQVYSRYWFESLDFDTGPVSINHRQAHVDDDGRVRVVVADEDPGVPNWIDVQGHRDGLLSYRWVWATTAPEPTCRVVASAELRSLLPATHPLVDPAERLSDVESRRASFTRRFRR